MIVPQPGDVILVRRGNGLFDRLVRWATVSDYFHAAIVVSPTQLVEARMGGVAARPIAEYAGSADVVSPAAATPEQRDRAVQFAMSRVGRPYGWVDIVLDAERLGLHVNTGYRWKRLRTLDCSSLVAAAWADAGVPLTLCPAPTPADLGYSAVLLGPRPWLRPNSALARRDCE